MCCRQCKVENIFVHSLRLVSQTSSTVRLRLDSGSIVLDMCITGYAHFWNRGLRKHRKQTQSTHKATTKLHKTILVPLRAAYIFKRNNKQGFVRVQMQF